MSEFHFHSLSWEIIDQIWQNFAYALILKTSGLGLLCMNFHTLITELWPLIDVGISFQLKILRTNWWNLTKFCICIYIGNIWAGINQYIFLHSISWQILIGILRSAYFGDMLCAGVLSKLCLLPSIFFFIEILVGHFHVKLEKQKLGMSV